MRGYVSNLFFRQLRIKRLGALVGVAATVAAVMTKANAGIDQNGNIVGGAALAPTLSGIVGGTQVLGFEGYQNGGAFQWENLAQNIRLRPTANGRTYISEVTVVAATSLNLSLAQVPVSSSVTFNFLEYTPGNILQGRIVPFSSNSLSVAITETVIPGLFISTSDGRTLQASQIKYDFSSTQAEMDTAGFFLNNDQAYSYAIGATFPQGQLFRTYIYNPSAGLVTNGGNVSRTQRAGDGGPILTLGINGEGGVDVEFAQPTFVEIPEPTPLPLLIGELILGLGLLSRRRYKPTKSTHLVANPSKVETAKTRFGNINVIRYSRITRESTDYLAQFVSTLTTDFRNCGNRYHRDQGNQHRRFYHRSASLLLCAL